MQTPKQKQSKPDYEALNYQGRFWTPTLSVDEPPPISLHAGDRALLADMPPFEDFKRQVAGDGLRRFPTGVSDYRRVRLSTLFPELEGVTLAAYYRLPRIRCCGFLSLTPDGELDDCHRCGNRGYVCPSCCGVRWVKVYTPGPTAVPCPSCTWDTVYSAGREVKAVVAWLTRCWPEGVR